MLGASVMLRPITNICQAMLDISNYIIYQDANNLYGCSMSEYLPYKHRKWDKFMSIDFILKIRDDHWKGYRFEVDLHCPVELHDKFKEFPPVFETLMPDIEWLTPYQRKKRANTWIIQNGLVVMALIN